MAVSEEIQFLPRTKNQHISVERKATSVEFFLSFTKTIILYSEKKLLGVVLEKSTWISPFKGTYASNQKFMGKNFTPLFFYFKSFFLIRDDTLQNLGEILCVVFEKLVSKVLTWYEYFLASSFREIFFSMSITLDFEIISKIREYGISVRFFAFVFEVNNAISQI